MGQGHGVQLQCLQAIHRLQNCVRWGESTHVAEGCLPYWAQRSRGTYDMLVRLVVCRPFLRE